MRRVRDLALLSVVLLTIRGCNGESRNEPPGPSTAPSAMTVSAIYDHLTIRHPSRWRLVQPLALSAGPSGRVAYLTDQRNASYCRTSTEPNGIVGMGCYPPVSSLRPNGIVVSFGAEFVVAHAPTIHNRVLDGHLATVQSLTLAAAFCVPGATGAVQMRVFIPLPNAIPDGSGQTVTMTACYAGSHGDPIKHDVEAMIDSVAFV
jgi:hypothetical protein